MRRNVFKKISAVVITTAVLFTTIFSLSSIAGAAVSFTPRLTAPDSSNKYYYNSNYNVFQKYGYGLPNCTAYAYGRAYEILGTEPKLSWNGAGQWYGYNQTGNYYKYGKTPKVGAIACWCYSGGGHVAVVEKIDSNGNMTLSNSEWGGRTFYLTYAKTTDSNPGGNSWWTFQGYIYLIDSADVNVDTTSSYKTGIYTTTSSYINLRSGAGLSYSTVGSVNSGVKLTVTQTSYVDGYNWGKTTYNNKTVWIALEYCKYTSALPQTTTAAPKTTAAPTTAAPTTQPTTAAPTTEPTTVPATTEYQYPTDPEIIVGPISADIDLTHGIGKGDVDADGIVTIKDTTLVQRYLANMCSLSDQQVTWSDFDNNGRVSIDDVTSMQRYLVNN